MSTCHITSLQPHSVSESVALKYITKITYVTFKIKMKAENKANMRPRHGFLQNIFDKMLHMSLGSTTQILKRIQLLKIGPYESCRFSACATVKESYVYI